MLKQNEVETCDKSLQEKLTVEVEFDENSSPSDKGDVEIDPQQQQEKPYSIAKRSGFTKYHRDMTLRTWLVLLS